MRHNWTHGTGAGRRAKPVAGRGLVAWVGLAVVLAATVVVASYGPPGGDAPRARLSEVSALAGPGGTSVRIEASEPVAYVTTRPDPLTVLVDLRHATTSGAVNRIPPSPVGGVAAVTLEDATATDGTAVARVRVMLASPGEPRVRSERNVIHVDVADDRPLQGPRAPAPAAAAPAGAPAPASPQAATRIEAVRAASGPRGVEVTLVGNGPLVATSAEITKEKPVRLVLDFADVRPGVPAATQVGKGVVQRVRVAVHKPKPLVTRVVFDLTEEVPYRVQSSGTDLKVLFGEAAGKADAGPAANVAAAAPAPRSAEPPKGAAPAPPSAPAAPAPRPPAPEPPPPPTATPPAAVPQSVIGGTPQSGAAPRQYAGHPISLDFQGADLRSVLRTFSEISALNMVIDPAVTGTVDVALRDVPWDQALDIILRANKLGYVVDGTIVRIAPLTVLAEEEGQRRKLADEQALSGELKVVTHPLSYARAEDLKDLADALGADQARRGAVRPAHQYPDHPRLAVGPRDGERPARSAGQAAAAGGDRGANRPDQPRLRPVDRRAVGRVGADVARPRATRRTSPSRTRAASAAERDRCRARRATRRWSARWWISRCRRRAAPSAWRSDRSTGRSTSTWRSRRWSGRARAASSRRPRVSTQNNQEAEVTQGTQIPIQTIANNTVTVTFKDAALTLKVTPQITASNTVIMKITLENASPDYTRPVGPSQIPPIDTQRAITTVLVRDGETTVIGGIEVSREQAAVAGTPGLSRIPLLKWLFKRDSISDESRELLIFITPRIAKL